VFAGKKSAQIREILISESAWEEMTCLFAPSLGSTGFENHIAIPHGKSSGVSRTALAIGRTQHAIPWETMDGSDVRCVILFAVCLVDQNATHIRLLAQVSGSLADEDIIAKLLVESDPHKIIALFNSETENADA
ncbi:PTS system 2-O-alpha-mannosyl-D-glycerate-specific EIIABC component, partial [Klebsiella pneumoniae]